jgi:hypothetical protein
MNPITQNPYDRAPARADKAGLARLLGVSRGSIHEYLTRRGGPLPDARGHFDVAAVRRYLAAAAPQLGARLEQNESVELATRARMLTTHFALQNAIIRALPRISVRAVNGKTKIEVAEMLRSELGRVFDRHWEATRKNWPVIG